MMTMGRIFVMVAVTLMLFMLVDASFRSSTGSSRTSDRYDFQGTPTPTSTPTPLSSPSPSPTPTLVPEPEPVPSPTSSPVNYLRATNNK